MQGDIFGLLYIAGEELPRSELIVMTGDTIKLALSNLALRATLREQAIIDPLTGLYNRRYLETSLSRELHRAQREQIPLTVAIIDIDHFKQFNDQYGHDAGDTLLRELAVIFREHLRQSDLACRFGGEEFVLILPGVNRATAQTRLQHLREVVQQRQIIFAGAPLRPVTISIGYFTCENDEIEPHILLQRADAALYAAKRSGRNRVVEFSDLQTLSSNERDE
ncbi:GGDEF domain-containing protein [Chloroflexus sp.]|uniref:GGDEF domain-containing protein n=1 Tax=Chloroflexus sp. TaxID=1904827 RepID=UPI003C76D920